MSNNKDQLEYMHGFGNEFQSEAPGYKGALPKIINPQRVKYGLFAEQLSGSAFTAPRGCNKRSWFYRKRPSVCHEPFKAFDEKFKLQLNNGRVVPSQTRWAPFEDTELTNKRKDFISGLHILAYSDSDGCAVSSIGIYIYIFNEGMPNKSFVNTDGHFLIVPQEGGLDIRTEFGCMRVEPNEIVIVQQGMKFSIDNEAATQVKRGYVLEVKGNHFELPNLGPIGANGLANPRDFQVPTAFIEDDYKAYNIVWKVQNELFCTYQNHSPYDVAAWFGNYAPFKYNLENFVTVNTVSVDHPDPSIFTVLTCPSIGKPGTALADFVIFPPRWECANGTFRPPYYHRNCMTEFMGLIKGQYQAKSDKFAPGGASLHQAMIPHGPDLECYKQAVEQDTTSPKRVADNTMAFMFETSLSLKLSNWALEQNIDNAYHECWKGLSKDFVSAEYDPSTK